MPRIRWPASAGTGGRLPPDWVAEITGIGIETLDQLANYMINRPETKIKIIGYTDSTGDYDYNLSVSKLRADKIKNYLCNNGVNSLNIETLGLGPDNPIASNATLEGRRKNRRVEIEFEDQFKKRIVHEKEGTLGAFLIN